MIKRIFFLIIISSFFSFYVSAIGTGQRPDAMLSKLYLEHAIEQFGSDNFREAFLLADISLTFFDSCSDALFIRGVSSREFESNNFFIEDLLASIIADNWKYYDEITARVFLSEYMYLIGDIESAYINLLPYSNNISNSSFFTEIFIRISLSLGKVEYALEAAENFLRIDPFDSYSQLIMALYDSKWRLSAEDILIDGDPSNFFSKAVVQIIIENSTDRFFLMDIYKNRWGEDRFYKIYNIGNKNDMLNKLLDELYPENSSINYKEITRIYSIIEDDNDRRLINEKLGSIQLTVIYDFDNDGYNDTKAIFNNGNLISFSYDSDQDKNYDTFVELDVNPVSLEIRNKGKKTSFFYKSYPNLINVTVSDKKSLIEYQLIPYTLVLDIIKLPLNPIEDIPYILDDVIFPDNDILTASSTQKNTTNFTTNIESKFFLIDSDETVETVFDSEGVQVIERHFKNSVLITVLEDIDGDGQFNITYEYKDGLLQTVLFDSNNNGIDEYIEDHKNTLVRSWDFNEDGLFDLRERYENGIIYRELSSNLNGKFDTFFETDGDAK